MGDFFVHEIQGKTKHKKKKIKSKFNFN